MGKFIRHNSKKIKVLWITNIPSPYRVDFFEMLGEKFDLTVIFEKDKSNERDSSWININFNNFKSIILNGITVKTDSSFTFKIRKYLKDAGNYDVVILSNPLTLMGMYSIEYLKAHKIPFWIETDGGFPKEGKGFKEKIKTHFISSASKWLSTAEIHNKYYIQYGAKENEIYRYPFTSIKDTNVLLTPVSSNEKSILKEKLGITQKKVVLGIGQFIYRKGFDLLLNISDRFDDDVAVVLLGGDITEEYREIIKEKNIRNVFFSGFISREKIADYYKIADAFVLPTREDIWGLVINEALSYGIPTVTTNKCIAGLELIKNGVNGYIIESEDSEALYEAINNVLYSKRYMELSNNSLEIARKYTLEKMVEWHEKFINDRFRQ